MTVKRKKSLDNILQQVNQRVVKLRKKESKCNNLILTSVIKKLFEIMKECNSLFCTMKPRIEYLGSYYDGLRVGHPTEYDLNVILFIPINYNKIELSAPSKLMYDYTNIKMPSEFRRLSQNTDTAEKGFVQTKLWCDSQYRISVKKFLSWMQSVADAALSKLPGEIGKKVLSVNDQNFQLSTRMSGPAVTITIVSNSIKGKIIDVDLVPSFRFKLNKKPKDTQVLFPNAEFYDISKYKHLQYYFVVPKPTNDDYSWRVSFPLHEKHYLKNINNLKSTVKLIKLIRDVQDFKSLPSYFIKTVFLWEIKNNTTNERFWQNPLSFLLIYMLKKLRDCLEIGEIKNFWCPENNLLKDKIKIETCKNWSNRLTFIINGLERVRKEPNDNNSLLSDIFKIT